MTGVGFLAPDEPVDLSKCAREPIHIPGAIQPYGALLAVREDDLVITQLSANVGDHLGTEPDRLLGHPLAVLLDRAQVEALRARLAGDLVQANPFALALAVGGRDRRFDVVAHRADGLVLLELEPAAAAEVDTSFHGLRGALEGLRAVGSVEALCAVAARELRRLTGYDRTMVYRFDAEGHGEIVAEERTDGLEPYLGHRYPASDIPEQARRLYLLTRTRYIPDVDYKPVPLLPEPNPLTGRPLDLSFSSLRSVSPIHRQYLCNMGVAATLVVSLVIDGALWGMLICHHRVPRAHSLPLRTACDVLGHLVSLLIATTGESEEYAYRLELQRIHDRLAARIAAAPPARTLAAAESGLLDLVRADGAAVRLGGGEPLLVGQTPPAADITRLVARVRAEHGERLFASDAVPAEFPEFTGLRGAASGLLLMPITHSVGDFVAWFRGEVVRTVTVDPETGVLNPRHSFAVWREQVRGQSRPWHPAELAIAAELRRTVASALLRQAEARLAHLGLHDALTGLPNRRLLGERLDRVARRAADRTRGAALLFLDVDRFKTINDSLGHDVGDRLLLQVAERLTGMLRPTDTVARLGGDEFVVLCEDTPAAEALTLAERVVAEFRRPFRVAGRSYYVTVSGGLAVAPGRPSHQLMRDADVAMYQAKRRGGNQVVVFDESLRAVVTRRLELEQDLHRALRRDEVTLVYQPVVRLADGRLVGVEALARWTHPTAGAIPPEEFIVLAEETGLIVPLGARILEEAIIQAAGWPRSGAADEAPTLAINLSVRQLIDPDLPATIERLLSASGLEPGRLCLEVTETGLMTDPELLGGTLEQLRRRGVGLAIDDFGTGYSSLAYLRRLPVTQLKIAQEFVGRLGGEGPDEALVAAVVALAHTLGLTTVAEGVETAAQADRLRELGCDLAQGYHFARPLPAADLASLLADPGRGVLA